MMMMMMIREVEDYEYSLNTKQFKKKIKKSEDNHGRIRIIDNSTFLSKPNSRQLDHLLAIIHHTKQQQQSALQSLVQKLQQGMLFCCYCYCYCYCYSLN